MLCWVLLAALTTGCASKVEVGYPAPPGSAATGIVLVRFSEPMQSVSVLVEGVLVVEDEHTWRVQIRNVPTGLREVTVVASGRGREDTVRHTEPVSVDPDKPAIILLATPPRSLGYWIHSAAETLLYGIFFIGLVIGDR